MNRLIYFWFVSLTSFFNLILISNTRACTAFCMDCNNHVVLAKNLDWPIDNGIICINNRGVKKCAFGSSGDTLVWISCFGSITFNQFGKEFPLGGINEKGLVIEELNNWGQGPTNSELYHLNEFQWTQYMLDNFESIDQIKSTFKKITIDPIFINLHYLIRDRKGQTAVIEMYNNEVYIYEDQELLYPVLSNNHYENSLKYLEHFEGFGGEIPIPKTNTSNERFVRVVHNLKQTECITNFDIIENAFAILDRVKQEDTQWSIVYDISNMRIYFKTKNFQNIKIVYVSEFDFSPESSSVYCNVNTEKDGVITDQFAKMNKDVNKELLMSVYDKFLKFDLGDVDKNTFNDLYKYGNQISFPFEISD